MGCMEQWDMDEFYDTICKMKTADQMVDYLGEYLDDANMNDYEVHRFEGGCAAFVEGFQPQVGSLVLHIFVDPKEKEYSRALLGAVMLVPNMGFDYTPYHDTILLFDGGKGDGARKYLESQGLGKKPFEIVEVFPSKSADVETVVLPSSVKASGSGKTMACSEVVLGKIKGFCEDDMEFTVEEKDSAPVSDSFLAIAQGVPCGYALAGVGGLEDEGEQIELLSELLRGIMMEENPGYFVYLTEGKKRYCLGCTKGLATTIIVGAIGSYDYRLYENELEEEDFDKIYEAAYNGKMAEARKLLKECLPSDVAAGKGEKLGPMKLADWVDDVWVDEIHWIRDVIPTKTEGAFLVRRNQDR